MAKRRVLHVVPDGNAGWKVKGAGAARATSTHSTKAQAVDAARRSAKRDAPSQVKIHGKDGRIQTEHTYDQDPYPPRG